MFGEDRVKVKRLLFNISVFLGDCWDDCNIC